MKSKLFFLLLTPFFLFSNFLAASEWKLRDMGTFGKYSEAYIVDFNDKGQALLHGEDGIDKSGYGVTTYWDKDLGVVPITHRERTRDNMHFDKFFRINGDGILLGLNFTRDKTELLTWEPSQGTKAYTIHNYRGYCFFAEARNSSTIILSHTANNNFGGDYHAQVVSLEGEELVDLTPALKAEANTLGYDAGDWLIIATNSQGSLLGRFDYYCYKESRLQKDNIPTGTCYFVYNKSGMTLIDWPDDRLFPKERNGRIPNDRFYMKIDSEDRVFYTYHAPDPTKTTCLPGQTWLWTKEKGVTEPTLSDSFLDLASLGDQGLVTGLLDDGTFLWSIYNQGKFKGLAFETANELLFLNLSEDRQLLAEETESDPEIKVKRGVLYYHHDYPVFRRTSAPADHLSDFLSAKTGQFYFNAEIKGQTHPFIIEKISE